MRPCTSNWASKEQIPGIGSTNLANEDIKCSLDKNKSILDNWRQFVVKPFKKAEQCVTATIGEVSLHFKVLRSQVLLNHIQSKVDAILRCG